MPLQDSWLCLVYLQAAHVCWYAVQERMANQLNDWEISPTNYMNAFLRQRGWKLPEQTVTIPNVIPEVEAKAAEVSQACHAHGCSDGSTSLHESSQEPSCQPVKFTLYSMMSSSEAEAAAVMTTMVCCSCVQLHGRPNSMAAAENGERDAHLAYRLLLSPGGAQGHQALCGCRVGAECYQQRQI